MSLLQQVTTAREVIPDEPLPPVRINIQGTDGIGKSTFGAGAPNVIFIQAEDGLNFIEGVARFPLANEWSDIISQIATLANEDHSYKSLVLDTTDAAALKTEAHVCEKNGWDSIDAPGFGKGYTAVREQWVKLLDGLNFLHRHKAMNIILLSHVAIKPFNDAVHESYDRWEMKCNKNVNALIKDWVDFNLFANYQTETIKDGSKTRGVSYGKRALHTQFAAAFDAKSRVALPPKIDLSWNAFVTSYADALQASPE
jgi:hypothetical protein